MEYGSGCSCPPSPASLSRHVRAQDSLAPGGDNQVVRENAVWSRSPRAQGSILLMLGVLRRIGQHGGRYDPSTVKRGTRKRDADWRNRAKNVIMPVLLRGLCVDSTCGLRTGVAGSAQSITCLYTVIIDIAPGRGAVAFDAGS